MKAATSGPERSLSWWMALVARPHLSSGAILCGSAGRARERAGSGAEMSAIGNGRVWAGSASVGADG